MPAQITIYVYENGVTDAASYTNQITVTDNGNSFTYTGITTYNNKSCAQFVYISSSGKYTITTNDAFDGISGIAPMVEANFVAYVELQKKNLYAWTIESGATANDGANNITTFYTDTLIPVLNTSTGTFSHLYNNLGKYYGGEVNSDLMSWTLTKNNKSMGETYVNSMDNSAIQLKAIGPA